MRIYSRDAFIALPAGTIFAKGKPWHFGELSVKGDTLFSDGKAIGFIYLSLVDIDAFDSGQMFDRLDEMAEKGASYPIAEAYGRDGCFDSTDLFLVYEKNDLVALKSHIQTAIELTV